MIRVSFFFCFLNLIGFFWVAPVSAKDSAGTDLREVTLQLKWKHQFQFAGYYAAVKKGFYRDAGLKVYLKELDPGFDPIDQVADGKAEFGIAGGDLVLKRSQGLPVVALSVVYQHSPLALVASLESGVTHLHQLGGKRVALESQLADLRAMFKIEGLAESQMKLTEHKFNPDDLLTGKIDALSVYTTDEIFKLREADFEHRLFSPRAYGIDFYGDTLFTSEKMVESSPEIVQSFRDASMKGWNYALAHSEEIIDYILEQYGDRHSREHLRFEAQRTKNLIMPDLLEIGYMHAGRWKHILETYQSIGLIERERTVDYQTFVYAPDAKQDYTRIYIIFAVVLAVLLLVTSVAVAFFRLNQRLKGQISKSRALREELKKIAFIDFLTGIANRRAFMESFNSELERIKRHESEVAILGVDLDSFKAVNDTYGHLFGDGALCHFVTTTQSLLRHNDLFGRTGGEEFCIVLPDTDLQGAKIFAARLIEALDKTPIPHEQEKVVLSVSVGISNVRPEDTVEKVMARADAALYEAKQAGRHTAKVNPAID